jgi:hypothetical protein
MNMIGIIHFLVQSFTNIFHLRLSANQSQLLYTPLFHLTLLPAPHNWILELRCTSLTIFDKCEHAQPN